MGVGRDDLDADDCDGIVFGVVDEPDRQRRSLARWRPEADGHLLVAGVPGSGRSTALAALATGFAERHGARSVVVAGGARSTEWDILHELVASLDAGVSGPRLVVLDDLDSRYRAWDDEPRQAMLDLVGRLLRDGRALGVRVAASMSAGATLAYGLREAFGAFVPLRHAGRGDLSHAGGAAELWSADDPPGSGQCRGRRLQVVDAGCLPPPQSRAVPLLTLGDAPCAIVSASPRADALALARASAPREVLLLEPGSDVAHRAAVALAAGSAPIVVGDADAWAANWMLVAQLRDRGPIVVHGGRAEFRAVVRERVLPPVLDHGADQCWRIEGGAVARRTWPARVDGGYAPSTAEIGTESALERARN